VALAGAREPVVGALLRWAQAQGGRAGARCLGQDLRLPAANAALVNATAAHALDYDDFAFSNHPSAVLCPAILAAADASDRPVSGERALLAYAVGYEIWADAFVRESDLYYDKGWHPTAVLGTLGAAAAASVVMGLDEEQTLHALALAASSAGGVFENFGTMAKPMHGGRASSVGVTAAEWAAAGLQASEQALEGRRGMLRAFSPAGQVDLARDFAPSREQAWIGRYRLNLKRFPVVGAAQRGIEAMLGWRAAHPQAQAAEVERIVAQVSARHAAVMPYALPQDALQAKFSLPFALACALLRGQVGLQDLEDAWVRAPEMQRLMACVVLQTTEEFEPGWRDAAPVDQLWVHLRDGQVLASPAVRRPCGHADLPMTPAQVRAKFVEAAEHGGLSAAQAQAVYADWMELPGRADVRALSWPLPGLAAQERLP
jgi:2-methylcitrate dehydratase PrpD